MTSRSHEIIKKLEELRIPEFSDSENSIESIFAEIDDIMLNRSRKSAVSAGVLSPMISHADKVVVVYKSLMDEDYHAGHALIAFAKQLGYRVYLIDKPEKVTIRNDTLEGVATGILVSLGDFETQIRITPKSNEYERGRTFVRAMQIKGLFNSDPRLTLEGLKRSQRFFGNNPGETETLNKREVPVTSYEKEMASIIREDDPEIYRIFLSILKRSYTLLSPAVIERIIEEQTLSFTEFQSLYLTKRLIVAPATGRAPAKEKSIIPHKPRSNTLLIKGEYDLICKIASHLFQNPLYCRTAESWISKFHSDGIKSIKNDLIGLNNKRAEFLEKYASLTTKRLQEARKIFENLKTKRKHDITTSEVIAMINARLDPVTSLVNEIGLLDPKNETILSSFTVRDDNTVSLGFAKARDTVKLTQEVKKELLQIPEYVNILMAKGKISPQGYYISALGNDDVTLGKVGKPEQTSSKNKFAALAEKDPAETTKSMSLWDKEKFPTLQESMENKKSMKVRDH